MGYKFKTKSFVLLAAGILSIIFGIVCSSFETGRQEYRSTYGGDSYTGIQNAAARTSENVYYLNEILKKGFTFGFVVAGVALIGASIPSSRNGEIVAKVENLATQKEENETLVEEDEKNED